MYYSGVSGRGIDKILGMNNSKVYNWIKKSRMTEKKTEKVSEYLKLDECTDLLLKKANQKLVKVFI